MWWLYIGNVEVSRAEFNLVIAPNSAWWTLKKLTILWSLGLKYVVIPGLSVILGTLLPQNALWDLTAGGTPVLYSAIGCGIVVVLCFLPVAIGAWKPEIFEQLTPDVNLVMKVADYPPGYEKQYEKGQYFEEKA